MLKRVRCRPESIRVREKGSSEVPHKLTEVSKGLRRVAAEAFYWGAAGGLTPSIHTVGQLVSLPNGAAGKGITAMADHDEKSLTSKMMWGHRVFWPLTGHYPSAAETVTEWRGNASVSSNLEYTFSTIKCKREFKKTKKSDPNREDSTKGIFKCLLNRSSTLEETFERQIRPWIPENRTFLRWVKCWVTHTRAASWATVA